MEKVSVAGLLVDPYKKGQLAEALEKRLASNQKTFIITPYSEFLYAVLQKPELLPVLNRADISVADGIMMLAAATFLHQPLRSRGYYASIFEAFGQLLLTLFSILLNPSKIKKLIPEKIVGADLLWDLAGIADKRRYSIYVLGGYGQTPQKVAEKLNQTYQNIRIAGFSNKNPKDMEVIAAIQKVKPDILFVAYGPIRQELWIEKHLDRLPVKLVIGLGGTFDYVAGEKSSPPNFIRSIGLEWLWRLFLQPRRIKRIYRATFGLLARLIRYKVFMSRPYRPNVIGVVVNQRTAFLVCRRLWNPRFIKFWNLSFDKSFSEYWQFPQGGIDKDEDLARAASREVREETGIASFTLLGISPGKHSYVWRNGTRQVWFNPLKFKGQEQSIAYLKFTGDDSEIKLDNREFDAWQWVSLEKLADTLHDERKVLIDIIKADQHIWNTIGIDSNMRIGTNNTNKELT